MSNTEQPIEEELDALIFDSLNSEQPSVEGKSAPIPAHMFLFPLLRRPFFPGMAAPLVVEPGPYFDALKLAAKSEEKCIGLLLAKNEQIDIHNATLEDFYRIGVVARILRIIPVEQGGAQVVLSMEKRMAVEAISSEVPAPLLARIVVYEDQEPLSKELKAYAISIISTIKELLKLNPLFKEELQIFLGHSDFTEPGKLADFAVALTTASREEQQEVLETFDVTERIGRALLLLKKELDISQLQNSINQKIEAAMSKHQKDFFLREQLKTIKKELGLERDDKSIDREKFEARIKQRQLPADVAKVVSEEMDKLSALDMHSAEYGVCRGYLDWLTIIPWGIYSQENNSICQAEAILAEDHYGLDDIKERILEFISVGKLSGGITGSIICLVGPPGVGKTSIGKSIARALNRKFYRFSVGGMHDESEIKGHRRTYIGAMPGKLVQALKYCQTMNPVIMLDEVDKMGNSFKGDPASALLEVLDPEQNSEFLDHYLDVRCNLSHVLFLVTANILDSIAEPLKDRMDILRLPGYIMEEKIEISRHYLIPRNRKPMGLKAKQLVFTTEALQAIINGYAREAGVRSLEHQIKKILRKIALKLVRIAENKDKQASIGQLSYRITEKNLWKYIGKPLFTTDRLYEFLPPGVCIGLAWTSMGGATLYVEAIKVAAEKTEMKLTGQAGDVMKESSAIAWSYLQSAFRKYAPGYTFWEKTQVHIHFPEGATPKDGPSAGITMVTALLSLLMSTGVSERLGMTGELTLTGKVLPIGGVREKVVAARRSGLQQLIFPKSNRRDYEELPEYMRIGLTTHFVETYDDVFTIAFDKKPLPL